MTYGNFIYSIIHNCFSNFWWCSAICSGTAFKNSSNCTALNWWSSAWSGSNRTGTKLGSATINFTAGTSTAKSAIGQVYVYPNPVKDGRFSVKVPEEVVGDVFYSLISTSGAEVETGKISVDRAGDNAEFNLDSFDNKNNGVYYLILQSKGSSYTVPLIKK